MEITATTDSPATFPAGHLLIFAPSGTPLDGGTAQALNTALDGALADLVADGELTGKRRQVTTLHTLGKIPAKRLLITGLGETATVSVERVRDAAAGAARAARAHGGGSLAVAVHGAPLDALDAEAVATAVVEGVLLGLYRFNRHLHPTEPPKTIDMLTLCGADAATLRRAIDRGRALAEATCFARDLANEPSNLLTPTEMARRASAWADANGLECQILEAEECERLGMGAFLGVARGSHQPPKFIVLRYRGGGAEPGLGLVGKGVTFDTGGISIKPAANMEAMKQDMSGGAAVIAAIGAIARLKPAVNVTAIVPATENMPGGGAIKPGDVLTAMNGVTIEVINTDAEGRLILADALCYANHLGLSPLVDVATLTGACSVALGTIATGLMTNDDALGQRVMEAGQRAGEKIWQLPMYEEYEEQIKSNVADVKNTGGRPAGAITAAKFLAKFAGDTPWVHLDMAGTDDADKDSGVTVKGATGVPVRALIQFVLAYASAETQK